MNLKLYITNKLLSKYPNRPSQIGTPTFDDNIIFEYLHIITTTLLRSIKIIQTDASRLVRVQPVQQNLALSLREILLQLNKI